MSVWKPDTKYRVKSGYKIKEGFDIIVDNTGQFYKVIRNGDGLILGHIGSTSSFNFKAFEEIKTKINHLPEWL